MTDSAKENQKIFKTLADTFINKPVQSERSTVLSNSVPYFSLSSLVVSLISLVVALWVFRKNYVLGLALRILSTFRSVVADDPFKLAYPTITPTFDIKSDSIHDSQIDIKLIIIIIIILATMMALILLYSMIKKLKKFRTPSSVLTLKINSLHHCVMVPIVTIPYCPSFWKISDPEMVKQISLQGRFRPCLQIQWKDCSIKGIDGQVFKKFPETLHISFCKGVYIRKILSTKFYVTPYFIHDNVVFHVENNAKWNSVTETSSLLDVCDDQTHV